MAGDLETPAQTCPGKPAPNADAVCQTPQRSHWRGILSRMRWPMHTGLSEGIQNRIEVIKRMAYGFRDTAHFFLKTRTDVPGKAR
ncbi:transposase [Metapseudomonas sp. CR1201]